MRGLPFPISFKSLFVLSIVLRVALIKYSEWHDEHSLVKYTDIDYRVFSDAARFLLRPARGNMASGPLLDYLSDRDYNVFIGSPYTRETYRYTPLLALALTPNEWIHPSFGKYLFAGCDILNGLLIFQLLVSVILPKPTQTRTAVLCTALYLLNPMVFSISTRGSAESTLASLVLLTLFFALKGRWDAAAVFLGLSVYWKIYPVIYGVSCLAIIGQTAKPASYLATIVNAKTIRFTTISAGTFLALGAACYAIWGYPFLEETYLYHIHRLDHRHNFSPYFYLTYLTYPTAGSLKEALPFWRWLLRSPLTSFVPQMSLAFGTGLLFGREKEDLVFAWFVQTVVFVVFNKVCTSQYFLWYLLLLPLLIPNLSMSKGRIVASLIVWAGTQGLWLAGGYSLEFLGEDVFYGLWVRGLVYVVGNVWVLAGIMRAYKPVSFELSKSRIL